VIGLGCMYLGVSFSFRFALVCRLRLLGLRFRYSFLRFVFTQFASV
jgi:hypothetical protein